MTVRVLSRGGCAAATGRRFVELEISMRGTGASTKGNPRGFRGEKGRQRNVC